jgi:hypothetical protein
VNTTRALTFLASPWSIAAGVVVWTAVAVISFISWRRSGYRADIGCLEALRLMIVALATILLNQPEWVEEYRPDEKPAIAVLWDESNSMTTKDVVDPKQPSSEARTRAAAIEPLTKEDAWSPLRGRFNVVMQPFAKPAPGKRSDLHAALASTLDKTAGLTAVVFASDGDWNEGEPPVEAAVRLRMANVPVLGIPVGSRQRLPDVELLSLDAPTFGIVGKNVRVPFTIDSSLPREYTATVVLRGSDGEEVTKDVRIAPQGRTSDSLLWKPKQTGDFTVTLEIPKHDSEAVSDNNRLDAPVSIREEKLRVLLVESYPRWEYRYLRNALSRDPGVELSCLLFHPGLEKVGGGNKDYIKAFPAKLEDLAPYDVVFLGDVGVEEGQLSEEQCRLLRGLVEFQASGLVFMPGMQGRQFSLLESPLEDVYPVLLDEGQAGGWGSRTPCRYELTASGQRSLLTKLADSQESNADVWDGLPGFQWYAPVLRAKAGTEVLCVHGDAVGDYGRLPLIVTRTYGAGKVLFMGTDGAWRWRKGVEDKYHYRFWGQVVRWMAYQRNMAKGETMRLYYTPDQPQLRKTITLKANVMEPTGEPLSKGEVVARVVAPSGNGQTIQFTPLGDEWGAFMGRYVSEEPGKHAVTLSCRETGASLEASFYVQGADKEPVGRPARPEVIEEISRVTRGKIVPLDKITEIIDHFQEMPDPPPQVRRLQIWCHPVTASLIVVLLGAFWVARKAVGLI